MPGGRYRVSVNGFRCNAETWDDALNWDGKHDEVQIATSCKYVDKNGQVIYKVEKTSPVMGDTNGFVGRVQAGSASSLGGIVSGDTFPSASPWMRSGQFPNPVDAPPFIAWEGNLDKDENVVFITPTIWEWDPGQSNWTGWLQWQVNTDAQFGQKAKDIVAGKWPLAGPVFDAVSLGIQTLGTLQNVFGNSSIRPIGMQKDANGAFSFNPQVLVLTFDTAEIIVASQPLGLGPGVLPFHYSDDSYFRGDYVLYLQVERVGAVLPTNSDWQDIGHANNVVAMAATNGKLFCATGDNRLWARDPVLFEVNWQEIGHANNVVAMTASDGKLFCVTSDNRLWARDPVLSNINWQDIGHANNVAAMAATNGKLFCATRDNRLWARDPVLFEVNWQQIGHANNVVAMAASDGKLFCVTSDERLWARDPVLFEVNWQVIGQAKNVVAMTANAGKLFCATRDNRLRVRVP